MKNKKKWKRVMKWTLGITGVLTGILIIHIVVMVKMMPRVSNPTIQMARADFRQPPDSMEAAGIQEEVRSLKGVKSTYYNQKDGILIYTFDNKVNNAGAIYDQAIKSQKFESVRYVVSADDLSKGCPVMNDHSFYGKLTAVISRVVN